MNKMKIEISSQEALELALSLVNQELESVKASEKTELHYKLESAKEKLKEMMDDGLWIMMGEFIDWCKGDDEVVSISSKYEALEHDDFINLFHSMDSEQYNYVEKNLTEFLIQADMDCEREKAVKISELIDYVDFIYNYEGRD